MNHDPCHRTYVRDERRLVAGVSMPRAIHEIKAILAERRNAVLRAQKVQHTSSRPHHAFDPNQPRVAGGNPDGGQWTSSALNDSRVLSDAAPDNDWQPGERHAARGRRSGSGPGEAEPGQAARLALAEGRALDALWRVRKIDPSWRPKQQSYYGTTVESEIRKLNDIAVEAEARIEDLVRPLRPLTEAYRSEIDSLDMFGHNRDPKADTVAVTMIGRSIILGSNSGFPGYTRADEHAAYRMRDTLIAKYPEFIRPEGNVGERPFNALFHAETTVLLRAAKRIVGRCLDGRWKFIPTKRCATAATRCYPRLGWSWVIRL